MLVYDSGVYLDEKVFVLDLLEYEIATVISKPEECGEYKVEFSAKGVSASGGNASKYELSSGVYLLSTEVWFIYCDKEVCIFEID